MGHKVNPIGLRLGINRTWIRAGMRTASMATCCTRICRSADFLEKRLQPGGPFQDRHRAAGEEGARHDPHGAPGRGDRQEGRRYRAAAHGARQDDRTAMSTSTSSRSASRRSTRKLVAENIAQQLERRVAFRRAMKRAVQSAMRLGALEGIRINVRRAPRRRGDCAHRMVPRGPGAAAHAPGPISTMARRPRTRPTAPAG